MPDKKPVRLLGTLIDIAPRAEPGPLASQFLSQEAGELAKALAEEFARKGGVSAMHLALQAESALHNAQTALIDYEDERPSEQARLAMSLLQAASLLMRQAQEGKAARATGKLKNGLKEYLRHHGERFTDDNLTKHVRRLVERIKKLTEILRATTIQAVLENSQQLTEANNQARAILGQAIAPHDRQEIEQSLGNMREALDGFARVAKEVEESPSFAAYFSAQAICTLWEAGSAWLLEKKMKEQGQRLEMPSVDSLAEKLVARFENKPRGRWGELAEDLLFDAVRLAGADAKSARKLVREPLKIPKEKP